MATSIITVRDIQERSKDGGTWLELVDQNNRTHRIFRRVQDNEGNWHDLSGKYDMLRTSQDRTLKLTTEQKGRFTNVIDVEMAEEGATSTESLQTAEEKDLACRLRTFTTAYAKDLAVAGKISTDSILAWSELLYRYLQGDVAVSDTELKNILRKTETVEQPPVKAAVTRRTSSGRTLEGATR